jgi:hypothetical protein
MREAIDGLLRQAIDKAFAFEKVVEQLTNVATQCQAKMQLPGATTPTQQPVAGV